MTMDQNFKQGETLYDADVTDNQTGSMNHPSTTGTIQNHFFNTTNTTQINL